MSSPSSRTILSDINQKVPPPSTCQPSTKHQSYDTSLLSAIVPRGFPKMAAMQMQFANIGTFRTFRYLHWRQLSFYETQLSYLENQLHRLDVAEDRMMQGSQKSRLPFNKERFADCEPPSVSNAAGTPEADDGFFQDVFVAPREKLYGHIERISKNHRELVGWLQKSSEFPRVPEEIHSQLLTAARELHGLEGEALQHLTAIDEMAYVNLHSFDSRIDRIWLSTTPWIKKVLRCLCIKRHLPDNGGSQTYDRIQVYGLRVLNKSLTILFSVSLLGIPAGILYLGQLSKPLSFGVLVIFSTAFSILLALIEHRTGHAVVGAVAYIAVLATFLANVQPISI